jgi:hypothetical protein
MPQLASSRAFVLRLYDDLAQQLEQQRQQQQQHQACSSSCWQAAGHCAVTMMI